MPPPRQANFEGTRAVLELAASCPRLRALVHVSSCFVNVNRPRSSVVAERLYPLAFGDQPVDAEAVASELLRLPGGDADMRAAVYMRRWRFPNTYTLGKHLTEQLVAKYQVGEWGIGVWGVGGGEGVWSVRLWLGAG